MGLWYWLPAADTGHREESNTRQGPFLPSTLNMVTLILGGQEFATHKGELSSAFCPHCQGTANFTSPDKPVGDCWEMNCALATPGQDAPPAVWKAV